MVEEFHLANEGETVEAGRRFAARLAKGDTALLTGNLGAGKTTFVRGVLVGLGHLGHVRSPSFQLLAVYELASLVVVHADLYRVSSIAGTGLEDYLGDAITLVEWPDRLDPNTLAGQVWRLKFEMEGDGRRLVIDSPTYS